MTVPGLDKRGIDFTDILMYLAIASKHVRLMVLLMCFSLLCGLDYYIYARPVYTSKALIRYQNVPLPTPSGKVDAERNDLVILSKLTSPFMISKVEDKLGNPASAAGGKKEMVRKLSADFTKENNILIDFATYNADWAMKFPQTLVQVFLDERDEERRRTREELILKYQREINTINERLKEEFIQKNLLRDASDFDRLKLEVEELGSVPRDIIKSQRRIADMDAVRLKLQDPNLTVLDRLSLLSNLENDLKVGEIIPSPGFSTNRLGASQIIISPSLLNPPSREWENLEKQYWQLTQIYNESAKIYLPRNPKMQDIIRKLDNVNRLLANELSLAIHRFDANYAKEQNRLRDLQIKQPLYEKKRKELEAAQEKYDLYLKSQLAWDKLYSDLMKEIKELENFGDKERVVLRFDSFVPGSVHNVVPVAPNRLKLVLYSLALGIALAIGVPFLLEFLDQTANSLEKIEQVVQVRGLGIVPKFTESVRESYPIINSENGTGGSLLEAFRVLRTNLMSAAALSKAPQVIMITSAVPKEGKTVVVSNLAASFAQLGEKTLVIDANLRRGLLHHPFRVRSSPGLSNILIDRISIEEACRPTDIDNLTVLPCGEHLDGDIEQLGSPLFNKLVEKLRQKYHRIIIDTPPVLGLSETATMQGVVDGVVLVVNASGTPMRSVKTAVDVLQANHANFYGFVLNQLDLQAAMNRFQYYYYSNHYYNRYTALEKVER